MADERKRIIEQTASTEIFDDDWFIKDSALHNTTKISQTVLKQEILKDVKGVVELTQAEYDALPSSKLTDGILYAIKDSEDIIGNIENAINTLSGDIDDLEELVNTEMYNTAPMWSNTSYTFDDLVVYGIDGRLYRCIVRNSTANQFVPAEWQATDIKAELYLLLQRIAPQFIASSQSYTQVYYEGNLVLHTNDYGVNTFYVCKQDLPQGDTEWVENHWEEVNTVSGLSKYLMDKIAEAGQIDDVQVKTAGDYESVVDENKVAKIDLSNMLIEKSVPNLPQPIATFNDGSDLPLKELKVAINPVQDLHGYDSPWAGGAGSNKWDEEWESGGLDPTTGQTTSDSNRIRSKNPIKVNPSTSYYAYVGGMSSNDFRIYYYDANNNFIRVGSWQYSDTFTTPNNCYYIKFVRVNTNTYNNDISINYPATVTTYSPYENICPISGWSGVNIWTDGVNLIPNGTDASNGYIANKYLKNDNTTGGSDATFNGYVSEYFLLKAGKYILTNSGVGNAPSICFYDILTKTFITGIQYSSRESILLDLPYDIYARCSVVNTRNFQLQRGEVSSEYEDYNGQTYTVPFTDSQGNPVEVYGGSVDVVNGGEQPSTLTSIDLGDYNYILSNGIFLSTYNFDAKSRGCYGLSTIYTNSGDVSLSDMPNYSFQMMTGTYGIAIRNDDYNDATTFKTAMAGKKLVYELATPTTFYTQPTAVKSLDGVNNVFASTGDVIEAEYIANATDVIANLEARVTALENA